MAAYTWSSRNNGQLVAVDVLVDVPRFDDTLTSTTEVSVDPFISTQSVFSLWLRHAGSWIDRAVKEILNLNSRLGCRLEGHRRQSQSNASGSHLGGTLSPFLEKWRGGE